MLNKVKIYCRDSECLPYIGSDSAAGMDLKSMKDFSLAPEAEITIYTGVTVELPPFTVGLVGPRSSLGSMEGVYVTLKNTIGFIDSDYRGEIQVKLINKGKKTITVFKGDRICQLIVVPHLSPKFDLVDSLEDLSPTRRGSGGWGSSGNDIKIEKS
jgi:dUTP pyrophosphatase